MYKNMVLRDKKGMIQIPMVMFKEKFNLRDDTLTSMNKRFLSICIKIFKKT